MDCGIDGAAVQVPPERLVIALNGVDHLVLQRRIFDVSLHALATEELQRQRANLALREVERGDKARRIYHHHGTDPFAARFERAGGAECKVAASRIAEQHAWAVRALSLDQV